MPIPIGGGPIVATYTVQADLSGTAYGGTPTWTDISSYVLTTGDGQPIQITGPARQDESSDTTPSQCSLTLINDDGRFTPGNSSSPYYPNVTPGVRVRVSESVAGTTYYRFDGYVDSWETTIAPGTRQALCAVSATDILARMGLDQPLRAAVIEEMLLDSPTSLYPLTEDSTASSAGDLTGKNAAAVAVDSKYGAGTLTFGAACTVAGVAAAAAFTSPDVGSASSTARGTYLSTPNVLPATASGLAVEVWFEGPTAAPTGSETLWAIPRFIGAASLVCLSLSIDATTGLLRATAAGTGVRNVQVTGVDANAQPLNVCDGNWHHAVITLLGDTITLYVDGVATSATAISSLSWANSGQPISLGMFAAAAETPSFATPFAGSLSLFAQYSAIPSATRVSAHYTAGLNAFAGERTDVHAARLLGYRANTGSSLDTGDGTVGVHDTDGAALQQALIDTAKAEGGLVYIDGQGRVVLQKRSTQYNESSSVTLDANANAIAVGTLFRLDTQGLVNDVTISRPNGADQRVVDTASQSAYGVRATSDTLIVDSDRDAADAAGWRVANGKSPTIRSPNVTVDLATETSTATAQAVLAAGPWTRMTLANLPTNAPASSMDVLIQGWAESIGVDEWTVTFYTTPVSSTVLQLDNPATGLDDPAVVLAW